MKLDDFYRVPLCFTLLYLWLSALLYSVLYCFVLFKQSIPLLFPFVPKLQFHCVLLCSLINIRFVLFSQLRSVSSVPSVPFCTVYFVNSNLQDDISDTVLVTDPEAALMAPKETVPMLQVSLQHKCITGKLNVEIIKARHMKTLTIQKAPGMDIIFRGYVPSSLRLPLSRLRRH